MIREKIFNKKIRDMEAIIYIICFFIYLLINRVVPLTYAITDNANAFFSMALAGIGVFLVAQDLFTDRVMFKTRFFVMPFIFLSVLAISDLVNIKYGWSDNLKTAIWFCIQFFVFYSLVTRLGSEKSKKLIEGLMLSLSMVWTILTVIGFLQFAFQLGYGALMHEGSYNMQGFIINRLFGYFTDPNAAAITSIIVILFNIYFISVNKSKLTRVMLCISNVFQITYIVLSVSRTAGICLFAVMIVWGILTVRNYSIENDFKLGKSVLLGAVSLVVCLSVFTFIFFPFKNMLTKVPQICKEAEITLSNAPDILVIGENSRIKKKQNEKENKIEPKKANALAKTELTENTDATEKDDSSSILDREDVKNETTLNHRDEIWKSYLTALKGSRVLIGLSPRNALMYITENCPDSYLLEFPYIPHSDYVAVIAYMGVAGAGVLLAAIICAVVYFAKIFFSKKKLNSFYITVVVSAINIALFGFSYMDVMFTNTLTALMFWIFMSYILNGKYEKED